jgi:hypothetical protein
MRDRRPRGGAARLAARALAGGSLRGVPPAGERAHGGPDRKRGPHGLGSGGDGAPHEPALQARRGRRAHGHGRGGRPSGGGDHRGRDGHRLRPRVVHGKTVARDPRRRAGDRLAVPVHGMRRQRARGPGRHRLPGAWAEHHGHAARSRTAPRARTRRGRRGHGIRRARAHGRGGRVAAPRARAARPLRRAEPSLRRRRRSGAPVRSAPLRVLHG